MAAPTIQHTPATPSHPLRTDERDAGDVFTTDADPSSQSYQHRFSSRFDIEPLDLSSTTSPSQLKRTIEAHLQETDRRLLDTQQLGNALLKQRDDLSSRLDEVEQYQDEATIPGDLRRRLADIEREHADVGREVARALIGPKPKQEDSQLSESVVFSSQATGSPTKASAPSRRHRNQPSTRAGDLQFAADISTSLLAQVRQLQAAVADRDEAIKRSQAEREAIEQEVLNHSQKIRALDESEQKYKDENWNLETQKHDLLNAARDAQDKEKRLSANLGVALADKSRIQNDLEELKVAHSKLSEEHTAIRKAHDTEIHGLKRNADVADTERQSLQDKIDDLIAQNQELARAVSNRSRSRQISPGEGFLEVREQTSERAETPDDSPPPSPTKATPRHGGLESETLRSSLHHAHRMIQNLKGNIHREKTEKIELKRMLQDARDELEHRRGAENGTTSKRQKTKSEGFKKPLRPDMLGGSRRSRTDIELTDDDWESANMESLSNVRPTSALQAPRGNDQRLTDLSDAYQTANDTEGTFDTADERNTTESEAFMTGAESLAGDSTDELTETEDTASRSGRPASNRVGRSSLATKPAGNRASYLSTASTSGDEADDMETPMQNSFIKFKLRNQRLSSGKQSTIPEQSTPDSFRTRSISEDSPATAVMGQSPPTGEQSLFAELGGMDELNSETHSTPARSSTMSSTHSTPGYQYTPSKSAVIIPPPPSEPIMVDASTMTEVLSSEDALPKELNNSPTAGLHDQRQGSMDRHGKSLLPSAFPLPPSIPTSPVRKIDTSTQYTPQRGAAESPVRPTSSHITPPKTIWDEAHETSPHALDAASVETGEGLNSQLAYNDHTSPNRFAIGSTSREAPELRKELERLQADLTSKETELENAQNIHITSLASMEQKIKDLEALHSQELAKTHSQLSSHRDELQQRQSEVEGLRNSHAAALVTANNDLSQLKTSHGSELEKLNTTISNLESVVQSKQTELGELRQSHVASLAAKQSQIDESYANHTTESTKLQEQIVAHQRDLDAKVTEMQVLRNSHAAALTANEAEFSTLRESHATELERLNGRLMDQENDIHMHQKELENLRNSHAMALANVQTELRDLRKSQNEELDRLNQYAVRQQGVLESKQTEMETLRSSHLTVLAAKQAELDNTQSSHKAETDRLRELIAGHTEELERKRNDLDQLRTVHSDELDKLRTQISGHSQEIGSKQTELEALQNIHNTELENMRRQMAGHVDELSSKQTELETSKKAHSREIERLQEQTSAQNQELNTKRSEIDALILSHKQDVERMQSEISTHTQHLERRQDELNGLRESHQKELAVVQDGYANGLMLKETKLNALRDSHNRETDNLRKDISIHQEHLAKKQAELDAAHDLHQQDSDRLQAQVYSLEQGHRSRESERESALDALRRSHEKEIEELRTEMSNNDESMKRLRAKHDEDLAASQSQLSFSKGEMKELQNKLRVLESQKAQNQPAYSAILSLESSPVLPEPALKEFTPMPERPTTPDRPRTAEKIIGGGIIASTAGSLGFAAGRSNQAIQVKEDPINDLTSSQLETSESVRKPLQIVHDNQAGRFNNTLDSSMTKPATGYEAASQQATAAERNNDGLKSNKSVIAPVMLPLRTHSPGARSPSSPTRYSGRPNSRGQDVPSISEDLDPSIPPVPSPRPGSASSLRTSSFVSQNHPPLPSDHKDIIAKANNRVGSPTPREAAAVKQGGIMGPPVMPASAMRRPRTPSESVRTASRVGNNGKRGVTSSQPSRRSSVSSFASELDERFNIRADQQVGTHGLTSAPGTDPRMIQAITQTMIGEYLWKYTRKAGSKEMSATRHRRYFWVHPYTKTLYWSDQDPQTAGRNELKAKSVSIQSVRVVSDDNPMPPGLHRKSLEITTPGRKVKFTASTGQRHETWFNALSYLLHRGEEQGLTGENDVDDTNITREDIAEFGVNGYGARLVPSDRRMSMSSYNSRTTNNTSRKIRPSLPNAGTLSSSRSETPQTQSATQAKNDTIRGSRFETPAVADKDRTIRASSRSRISKMFGSVTTKTKPENSPQLSEQSSQARPTSSIYDASVVSENRKDEEQERKTKQAQDENPGLEDVRACCDGKHNVSTLAHRQSSSSSTHNRLSNAITRSMSRRN